MDLWDNCWRGKLFSELYSEAMDETGETERRLPADWWSLERPTGKLPVETSNMHNGISPMKYAGQLEFITCVFALASKYAEDIVFIPISIIFPG